ncbi:MAG: 50S ribosomal protein L3 N(5)-glutamine methyltransferase [Gammaproteobacteria bacterium]
MSVTTRMTLAQLLEQVTVQFDAAELFYGHGTDNPWDEAVYLIFTALGIAFDSDDSIMSRPVSEQEIALVTPLIHRRIEERVPVAYLVQEAWFAGLPFTVDERVLIPRSPLAELIGQGFASLIKTSPTKILDLCTGSGCIGIATARAFEQASVELADISTEALSLAQTNIERHGLQSRVRTVASDLLSALEGPYDLILSNPPYVSQTEIDELPPEYRYEPTLGLFSEEEGLAIPLQILRTAANYLSDDGVLIMEVGYSHEALSARLPQVPFLWLEFEHGGEGIFMLTAKQLREAQTLLS